MCPATGVLNESDNAPVPGRRFAGRRSVHAGLLFSSSRDTGWKIRLSTRADECVDVDELSVRFVVRMRLRSFGVLRTPQGDNRYLQTQLGSRRLKVEVAGPVGGGDLAADGHALEFDPGDEREAVQHEPGPFAKMNAVVEKG
jgi:hypothetical protein